MLPAYAELHCISNFTFLRGASSAEELVGRAKALGYEALAITDECSLAGIVRGHLAAKQHGIRLVVGAEFVLGCGMKLVLLAQNRAGYGNLSALITLARRRAGKGSYRIGRGDLEGIGLAQGSGAVPDCLVLWVPQGELEAPARAEEGRWLAARFPGRAWLAVELHSGPDDAERLRRLLALAAESGLPAVAAGDVHMHVRSRRALQDTLTALRLKTTVEAAGHALYPNGERHLRTPLRLARFYPPELLAETLAIAARCDFSLDELRYETPSDVVPPGETAAACLRRETEAGLATRYPQGIPGKVRAQVEHELALIAELAYEPYFLTVHDIVRFARERHILCQGRGSAANSAVCYALGITEVDPARSAMLFERFISKERNEPPDIDVDFEHERREEVIQYLYGRYGRERAALAAAVTTYRTRGSLRDVGRALGFDRSQIDALTASLAWWDHKEQLPERFAAVGLDPQSPRVVQWLELSARLRGFPRHLSQHVGGFVITRGPLSRLVPVENAAMPERSVIQWDKDDIDALGLLKVDILALGMLSCIRRALDLVSARRGRPFTMADVAGHGAEDQAVYAMLCKGDSMGVFQVESRAQMAMLPRLRPRRFYDLVIEVAIVRPGPIQGGMVHPYLRRRNKEEAIEPMTPEVEAVLGRTLGVPIFQEQVMALAVAAAGFTPGEADQLRRGMAAWKKKGGLEHFEHKLVTGMAERGYSEDYARRIVAQIHGFGEYGFPESHAASFALLVYVSAWLKCHEPAAFLCALLNSQPMGFYSASMLIQDARRHGVDVLPPDATASDWDCTLETTALSAALSPALSRKREREPTQSPLSRPAGEGLGGEGGVPRSMLRAARTVPACKPEHALQERESHPPGEWPVESAPTIAPLSPALSRKREREPTHPPLSRPAGEGPAGEGGVSRSMLLAARTVPACKPERALQEWEPHPAGEWPVESAPNTATLSPALSRKREREPTQSPLSRPAGEGSGERAPRPAAESSPPQVPTVRLGLRQIKNLGEAPGRRIAAARSAAPFASLADLAARAGLSRRDLDCLAAGDALQNLAGHRRQAAWQASAELTGLPAQADLFAAMPAPEAVHAMPEPRPGETLVADYAHLGLTLRQHPLCLLRERLTRGRFVTAEAVARAPDRQLARAAGIVTGRQRPGTASGIVFVTLEDETGWINVVVHPHLADAQRRELLAARLLGVYGQIQRHGDVVHLVAKRLVDCSKLLGRLPTGSRDFH